MGEPWLIYRHTTVAPFCSLPSWTYVFSFSNKKMYLTLYVYSRCRVVDNTIIFWSHFFSENAETCGGSSRYFERSPLLISKCRHKKKQCLLMNSSVKHHRTVRAHVRFRSQRFFLLHRSYKNTYFCHHRLTHSQFLLAQFKEASVRYFKRANATTSLTAFKARSS